jgi:hypothetical protein
MCGYGVTIELMARVYQQARAAGALDPGPEDSAAAWFEQHRAALFQARRPWVRSRRWFRHLGVQLLEGMAAVEEANRVAGLARLVEEVRRRGQNTLAVMRELRRTGGGPDAEACPFTVWGLD